LNEQTPADRIATCRAYEAEVERRAAEQGRDLDYEAEQDLKTYGIVPVSSIAEEPTTWLWEGFFPWGELSIVEGDPDTGKTLALLNVAAAVTRGTALPPASGRAPAQNVLYLTSEDSVAKTIRPRLDAAGADLDRVFVQQVGAAELLLPGAVARVENIVRAVRARVVMLDPLNAYLDASKVNVNREQDVRQALRPVRDLAERRNLVVAGLRHLNKATDKPSLYRGGGSIGLAAVARSVVLVAKHPEDATLRVMLSQKCNIIGEEKKRPQGFRIGTDPKGRPKCEWLAGSVEIDAEQLLGPKRPGPAPAEREKAERFLRDFLADGEKAREVVVAAAEATDIDERMLDRAATHIGVTRRPEGKRRFWSLPGRQA
jgi:AAA domain-containing protein